APGADLVDIDIDAYESEDGAQRVPGEDYQVQDEDPSDHHGHGTHCAGIVAATANNGLGISGVCPGCRMMPVRAGFSIRYPNDTNGFDEYGLFEYDDIANAIVYAVDSGARVISMSFGGSGDSSILKDAINYARGKGVVLVAAAGNSNSTEPSFPAAYPGVISVAATESNDSRASFSNYGYWVTVAAPGRSILSTLPKTGTLSDPSGYGNLSGTSMATPYVAGLAGLLLSQNPSRTATQVQAAILSGTKPISSYSGAIPAGVGIVNVLNALQSSVTAQATLTAPQPGTTVKLDALSVEGTATGFRYVVELGEGAYPQTWKWVGGANQSIATPQTLATVSLSGMPSGAYSIRLRVEDSAGASIEKKVTFVRELPQQTVAAPTFSLAAGSYSSPQQVALSSSTPGATLRYKTDGTKPDCSSGTVYSQPVAISQSTTLQAIACKVNWLDSQISTATYTLFVAPVALSLPSGTYETPQTLSLLTSTSGSTIRYTTNGTSPTCSTGMVYTNPISLTRTGSIQAIGCRSGWTHSSVTMASYTMVDVLSPTFSPPPGKFRSRTITLTILSATTGTTLFYTVNGRNPSCGSGTRFSKPIQLRLPATVRVIACKSSGKRSEVVMGVYR
ncbi:MAG: chitobiase/beta-hexosaminidase C-terminal domain-containing protein, partial [Bdellovibrionales bacterium]|nr:chitobiase/beta-hexosaminidase C-terminal domain-containing protein [Bdellovibrionales bacterium]